MGTSRIASRQQAAPERTSAGSAAARAPAAHANPVQLLQRRLGNQGTAAFISRSVLNVSSPHDPAEREAVAKAAEIMRMPAAETDAATTKSVGIQRCSCEQCSRNSTIHREASGTAQAPNISHEIHSAVSGSGTPLPGGVRSFMEPRFGASFDGVRIHTGEHAAQLSADLSAHAFTVGNHIFFGKGQYQPDAAAGKELIAHELTHTIQQGATVQRSSAQVTVQRDEQKKSWWESLTDWGESYAWDMVRTVAPSAVPILQKGPSGVLDWIGEKISNAADAAFNTFMAPVRAIAGVGDTLSALFSPMLTALQTAAGQIARNDCSPIREAADKIEKTAEQIITPIVEKLQPVVAKVKGFLNDVWDKIGAPIWDWIKTQAKMEWEAIQWLVGVVQGFYSWIWEKTAWVRSLASKAWTWIKNKLGIGEGPEGQDGLLQWVQGKVEAAWNVLKAKIEPFKKELTAIGLAVGGVLIAISPAGPVLAIVGAVAGAVQGLRWIAAHWGKGDIIVQARAYLEKTLIPPLLGAAHKLSASLTHMAESVASALGSLSAGLGRAAGALAGSVLRFFVSAVQWLADQATSLTQWAVGKLAGLATWVNTALDKLQAFLKQILALLARVGAVILDIYGLPILLAEKVWNLIPACIRDPIVDFLGPIILRQIELFSELVRDNDAWQKTKADVMKLIHLVFKDHDLVGAVKAAFHLVLRVFNIPVELLVTIGQRAMAAWDVVSKKPLEFIKNTVRAIGQGFKLLKDNFMSHLQYGLEGWLFGELAEKKITRPSSWTDPKAVFGFVLDVLGISVDHVYELLKKRFDPVKVDAVRKRIGQIVGLFAWVDKAIDTTKSPADNARGMIDQAKDFGKQVLTGIAEWVAAKVAEEIAVLAAAAAASGGLSEVLDVIRRVYKVLVSIKRYLAGILNMVNEGLESIIDLATGKWEPVGAKFEKILHRGMPIVIGFLAEQVGLGGIGQAIRDIVDKLREKVDAAILWVIDKIKAGLEWLIGVLKAGVAAVVEWWRERRNFPGRDGTPHSVYVDGGEEAPELMVATVPRKVPDYLSDLIDDGKTEDDVKAIASQALGFYNAKIAPMMRKNPPEELKTDFSLNLTTLSQMLMKIVGASTADLPDDATWTYNGPAFAGAELLSTKTSIGGTEPSGNPPGWEALQAGLLTRLKGDWKRMHMITAGVGGKGVAGNLVPAPTSVNSGSNVRGFEVSVEDLVKRENSSTKKPNVVWIEVRSTSYHPSYKDPVRNIFLDAGVLPAAITFRAGLHYPKNTKQWEKDTKPVLTASDTIPFPRFEDGPVDINIVGRVYIAQLTLVSDYFAQEIANRRGSWTSYAAFVEEMNRGRKEAGKAQDTDEFQAMLAKVRSAYTKRVIKFGDS
jgi:phage-related protein